MRKIMCISNLIEMENCIFTYPQKQHKQLHPSNRTFYSESTANDENMQWNIYLTNMKNTTTKKKENN